MGIRMLSCESFFPGLVASPFVDLEKALFLTDYRTPMDAFWGPLIFLLQGM
jgi:hypothetical protein